MRVENIKATMALIACSMAWSVTGHAASNERKGPLKDLPSKEGAHIAKIKALGDNSWLNLGSPKADPKWGKARGSSWGANALVFAPDLRGAFLFGEGRHAFVKPDGYGMDDLWFYDINAHTWICLHPGVNTKDFTQQVKDKKLKIDKDGRLVDKDGHPFPIHTKIHAWGYLAYDSNLKRLTSLGAGAGFGMYYVPGGEKMKEGYELLKAQGMGKKGTRWSPLFYDTLTGKFDTYPVSGSYSGGSFPKFLYLPNKKHYILLSKRGVWFFDPAKRKWTGAKTKGVKVKGYDISGCYDSKRDRVYLGNLAYDIKSSTWIDLNPKGTGPSRRGTNNLYMEYDSVTDKVIAIQFRAKKSNGVFVYDPEGNTWRGPSPLPKAVHRLNVAYDPELNVYFCHVAGDSRVGGMWVYRHKRRKKK